MPRRTPERHADHLAALEAELTAGRRADDPGALELAAWARRRRESLELAIASANRPPADPRQERLF